MSSYSDLVFLLGAIVIYGLLVNNTARTMSLNNQKLSDAEIEHRATSAAQDILDQIRWKSFSDLTQSKLNAMPGTGEMTDDPIIDKVEVIVKDTVINETPLADKKITVKVSSPYIMIDNGSSNAITLSMTKSNF